MKTVKLLIILCVLLATFLIGGIALALEAPALTVTVTGTTVSLSWTSVAGATGYTLYYAPYPKADPIGNIPMGDKTSMSASLPDGSAFYVALQAYNSFGNSGYSNIEHFIIDTASTYTNSLGQTFNLLPAGTFTMGSPSDEAGRDSDEGPQHQVTLTQSFYMQTTEVTQSQWEAVMGSNPSGFSGCSTCPVESVSWNDVQSYITKMNLRGEGTYSLPTEAQWEYAARAGSTTAFYNGGITETGCDYDQNLDAIGWYCYNSGYPDSGYPHPVAGKAPNAWGLYDMSGNVWEFCQDWYASDYYSNSPTDDPQGPSSGSSRVIRGGGWNDGVQFCRAAYRYDGAPGSRGSTLGFRLVLSSGHPGSPLTVDPVSLNFSAGETKTVTISGGTSPYSANSSNTSVATASVSGSILSVTGLSEGSATITVSDSGSDSATVSVTVTGGTSSTYTNSLGQTFNLLPAGTFTMGSPSDEGYSYEGPQHEVTLTQPFYMQTTEVTQSQWEAVVGSNPSGFPGCSTCPVETVSWDDVQDYITKMNLRGEGTYSLPTEAQWEYSARAGSTTAFYNGEITGTGWQCRYDPNLDAIGWYCYSTGYGTNPVAGKAPNAWGLYDMSGNVWEWCSDWWSYDYYSNSPTDDPQGPSTGDTRVIRGGSWYETAQKCRSASRGDNPGNGDNSIGFRLVLSSGQ